MVIPVLYDLQISDGPQMFLEFSWYFGKGLFDIARGIPQHIPE